ncbi:hypothetical protein [Teredinibacter haidensis]|uniref:hypothetical protein n=1 Tax=Teredinibacter haidensis TaxID=2731755 RepID=UPI000948E49C|nr:hypothetical protein [Teredinibacter haidensis]
MKISLIDQTKYPKFTQYIRFQFPKLIKNSVVVKNAAKYGNLSFVEFKNTITWGTSPEIVITDLHSGQCGVPKAYGCFRHSNPGNIEIHIGVIKDFEKNSANTIDKNKAGNAVYVAGATILHELCHWGNHNNIPPIPEVIEMGAEFEKSTYGKVIY